MSKVSAILLKLHACICVDMAAQCHSLITSHRMLKVLSLLYCVLIVSDYVYTVALCAQLLLWFQSMLTTTMLVSMIRYTSMYMHTHVPASLSVLADILSPDAMQQD